MLDSAEVNRIFNVLEELFSVAMAILKSVIKVVEPFSAVLVSHQLVQKVLCRVFPACVPRSISTIVHFLRYQLVKHLWLLPELGYIGVFVFKFLHLFISECNIDSILEHS